MPDSKTLKAIDDSHPEPVDGTPHVESGQKLGPYSLAEPVGDGLYGIVWRAVDNRSGTDAAIKIFRTSERTAEDILEAAERFRLGVAAMRKLAGKTPYVVSIFEGPHLTEKILWFAMEYCELRDVTKERCKIDDDDRGRIVDGLLHAITAAHDLDIRHRDIRPENILLRRRTGALEPAVCDFDLAYFEPRLRPKRSTTATLGTDRYLPPEVRDLARTASPAEIKAAVRRKENDLYAIGMTVYDLFSGFGKPPVARTWRNFRTQFMRAPGPPGHTSSERSPPQRRRAALLCASLLDYDEANRLPAITDVVRSWSGYCRRDRVALVATEFAMLLVAIAAGILWDWSYYAAAPVLSRLAGVSIVGALTLAASIGALLLPADYLRARISRVRRLLGNSVHEPARAWVLLVGLVVLCIAVAVGTGLTQRMRSYHIPRDADCVGTCVRDTGPVAVVPHEETLVFPRSCVRREYRCSVASTVPTPLSVLCSSLAPSPIRPAPIHTPQNIVPPVLMLTTDAGVHSDAATDAAGEGDGNTRTSPPYTLYASACADGTVTGFHAQRYAVATAVCMASLGTPGAATPPRLVGGRYEWTAVARDGYRSVQCACTRPGTDTTQLPRDRTLADIEREHAIFVAQQQATDLMAACRVRAPTDRVAADRASHLADVLRLTAGTVDRQLGVLSASTPTPALWSIKSAIVDNTNQVVTAASYLFARCIGVGRADVEVPPVRPLRARGAWPTTMAEPVRVVDAGRDSRDSALAR